MKTGRFQAYIISLLLIFAFCGTRVVVVWDFSDYHDVNKVNIDQADSHGTDMDDVKNKQLVYPPLLTKSFDLSLPALVETSLNPLDVQLTSSLTNITPSFPSRASPA